ncbi:MAG: metal-dependent hydrolase [Burkholderiales bacterium]
MTELVVRKLLIDLSVPFPGRWCGGDAFRSAFFSALSMSFPVGEQYFIDSVRAGLKALSPEQAAPLAREVQGFVGQEATHRRIHTLFNDQLAALGYTNVLEQRVRRRLQRHAHFEVRIHVAATAATEHITAMFADWLYRHPEVLQDCEPRLQTLWMWHAAEEAEHCSTAFDIYRALDGSERWRGRMLRYVTLHFALDVLRQTVRNLWHDRSLFQWSTWRSGAQLLFARDGMVRGNARMWRAYLRADFHPRQQDTSHSRQWLQDNSARYSIVGQPSATSHPHHL